MNSRRIRWAKALASFAIGSGWIGGQGRRLNLYESAPRGAPQTTLSGGCRLLALAGEPLHVTAYAADPRLNPSARPIGFAFWTTDLLPLEHGYHGPIHILVGMDLTAP